MGETIMVYVNGTIEEIDASLIYNPFPDEEIVETEEDENDE